MQGRLSLIVVLAMSALLGAACRRTPPAPPPAPSINQDSVAAAQRVAAERVRVENEARARAERETAERTAREAEDRARREREDAIAATRTAFGTVIYFAFDKSDLSEESRATLDAKLPLLRANPAVRIRIAGHTDERGSDSYNMALGQRRAAAAKRYLVEQGIGEDRIETVSFGEDRPVDAASTEEAWAKNRRDAFEIIVGGETLRLP